MKTATRFLLIIILALVSATASATDTYEVTAQTLNVRQWPSRQSAVMTQIRQGTHISVNYIDGDWANVTTQDKKTGWVSKKYIRYVRTQAPQTQLYSKHEDKSRQTRLSEINIKSLKKWNGTFEALAVALSLAALLIAAFGNGKTYLRLGIAAYIGATMSSALYFVSSPAKDLTGLFTYIFFCLCLCVILFMQLDTFKEFCIRTLRRTSVDIAPILHITFIAMAVVGLATGACFWFDSDLYKVPAIILAIAVLAIAVYIGTDAFTFDHIEKTLPAALFFIYGCAFSYVFISLAIAITIPFAILLAFGYAFGSNGGSVSSHISGNGKREDDDNFSWTGYIPNFHKDPTGGAGWDDEGNTYWKGSNGDWHKRR